MGLGVTFKRTGMNEFELKPPLRADLYQPLYYFSLRSSLTIKKQTISRTNCSQDPSDNKQTELVFRWEKKGANLVLVSRLYWAQTSQEGCAGLGTDWKTQMKESGRMREGGVGGQMRTQKQR